MRAVVQRVKNAKVTNNKGKIIGEIKRGLLVFLGVEKGDNNQDADYLALRIGNLRIFEDKEGKMNLSLAEIGGEILVISQFTLLADCRKGRRPSFDLAAEPKVANELYQYFLSQMEKSGIKMAKGAFQTMMEVSLVNQGPATFLLDSKKNF